MKFKDFESAITKVCWDVLEEDKETPFHEKRENVAKQLLNTKEIDEHKLILFLYKYWEDLL